MENDPLPGVRLNQQKYTTNKNNGFTKNVILKATRHIFKDLKENLDIMKEKTGDLGFTIRMNNKKKNKKQMEILEMYIAV